MKIEVDHDEVRSLMTEINRKLIVVRATRKANDRRNLIDEILEGETSELIQLAKILKIEMLFNRRKA